MCDTKYKLIFLIAIWIVISKPFTGFSFFRCPTDDYGTIEHVSIIHRHGDRTPILHYPKDPHFNYTWVDGYGQLTKKGKISLHQLGQYLRQRYGKLLGYKYNSNFINITSSEFERALCSSYCLLSGLFPPHGEEIWDSNIKWQPVPVRSLPMDLDDLIATTAQCDRYSYEKNQLETHPFILEFYESNRKLYEEVSFHTGLPIPESILECIQMISFIYDVLLIQTSNGLKLPEWAKDMYPFPLEHSALQHFKNRVFNSVMKRLNAGPLIKNIIRDIHRKLEKHKTKMHIYSGHDNTVSGVMLALDCFNDLLVPYASALLFELRKKNDEYFVMTFFKNSSADEIYPLRVKGCVEFCPLEEFIERTKSVVPDDWKYECQVNSLWSLLPNFNAMLFRISKFISSCNFNFLN